MSYRKKHYRCQVTIFEGTQLTAADDTGSCDPFVRMRVGNSDWQQSSSESDTTDPSWKQSFSFLDLKLTDAELQTWELKIECWDYNSIIPNKFIGGYSYNLASIYNNSDHEFHMLWIPLLHPDKELAQGYLHISCFVLGDGDRVPSHPIGQETGVREDEDPEDDMFLPAPGKNRPQQGDISGISAPIVAQKTFQFAINIYKAEIFDQPGGGHNLFVSCRVIGLYSKTEVIAGRTNPSWRTRMSFPAYKPILNDRITVRLWDKVRLGRDTLIASIPEVPTERDMFTVSNLLSRGGIMPCRWVNLYSFDHKEESL